MANSNGKIVAPVDIKEDIYKVLGIGARTLSDGKTGYLISYACMNEHEKINKWSRVKPTPHEKMFSLTIADRKDAHLADGTWIPFGLLPPKSTGGKKYLKERALVDYSVAKNYYIYYPPTATTSASLRRFRFSDFNGYFHNAEPNFTCAMYGDSGQINLFDEAVLKFGCSVVSSDSSMSVMLPDFYQLTEYVVFTVEVYRNLQSIDTEAPYLWVASPVELARKGSSSSYPTGTSIEITISELRAAYKAAFPSDSQATQDALHSGAVFCFGFNRLNATGSTKLNANKNKNHFALTFNDVAENEALVAPLLSTDSDTALRVMTRAVAFANYFKYTIIPKRFWSPLLSNGSGAAYISYAATSATGVASPDLGLEVDVTNQGTTTIRFRGQSAGTLTASGQQNILLRAMAEGEYNNSDMASYNTPTTGKIIVAQIRANVTTSSNGANGYVDLTSNQTKTFGLYFPNLLPKGTTKGVLLEASSDGGNTWIIASHISAWITRN